MSGSYCTRRIICSPHVCCANRKTKMEALFVYNPIDDFVLTNVAEFNGRKVVSAEAAKLDVEEDKNDGNQLTDEQQRAFGDWLASSLEQNVKEVKVTRSCPLFVCVAQCV